MKTLWVTNNAEGRPDGSLTPPSIPPPASPGKTIMVEGPVQHVLHAGREVGDRGGGGASSGSTSAIPQTMAMQYSIEVPQCKGINHADFSIDGRIAIFHVRVSRAASPASTLANRKVLGYLKLSPGAGCPQDIRSSPRRQPLTSWPT